MATRAELRQPGVLERVFGGAGPAVGSSAAPGMGSLFAGTFLSSMAGTVLGSMIAQQFFHAHPAGAGLFGDSPSLPHEAGAGTHDAPSFWRDNEPPATDPGFTEAALDDPDAGGFDSDFDAGGFDV